MYKLTIGATLLCTFVAGILVAEDKKPSIEDVMKKVNSGKNCLRAKVGSGLKELNPTWDEIAKQAKEINELAQALGKNDPPKGDKQSWEKLTKEFADNAKKLKEAVDKKDKDAAQKAFSALSSKKSCDACHAAHKE